MHFEATIRNGKIGVHAPKRIAVFRALMLGDLLCAVPALRALRAAHPRAEITLIGLQWARSFAARFKGLIDDFIEFPGYPGLPEIAPQIEKFPDFLQEAQARKFDLAIQLHGSGAIVNPFVFLFGAKQTAGFYLPGEWYPDSRLFMPYPENETEVGRLLRLMKSLGAPPQGDQLEFPLSAEDERAFNEIKTARHLRAGEYVCIHPGARSATRRWSREKFAAVADRLAADGWQIVLTGTADEKELTQAVGRAMKFQCVDLAGRTDLGALAALLKSARLLISNDTGVSHIAAAFKTPRVVIVLSSDAKRWQVSTDETHAVVSYPVDCRPCAYSVCPIGHLCAVKITPEMVIAQARQILSREAVFA